MTNNLRDYISAEEIMEEVERTLRTHKPEDIDWVTFVGSGEPTLHASLGWMIRHVKRRTAIPVAVVTNGSLLHREEIREALKAADAVLPSLDAGTAAMYRSINRPLPDCTFDRLVTGLTAFRSGYAGKIWVEVMLIQGLNDTEAALHDIGAVLSRIGPDEIHISSPLRPPAEAWVKPPDEQALVQAAAIFGDTARVVRPTPGAFDLSGFENVADAVLAVILRHPVEEDELMRALHRWAPCEVGRTLAQLAASNHAQVVNRHDHRFWTCSRAKYQKDSV